MPIRTLSLLGIAASLLWVVAASAAEPAKTDVTTDAKIYSGTPVARSLPIDPLDWPNWRGPEQNRISRETGLVDKFDPASDLNVIWKDANLSGISTPIVMHGKLYTIVGDDPDTRKRLGEKLVCVDAATGHKLWEVRWNMYLTDVPPERVGWSSCVGDPITGRVYAQGTCGYFCCVDGESGKQIWSRSLSEEFGVLSTYGGRTGFPSLFEDMVVVNSVLTGWGEMAKPAHRFIAMDKNTGEVLWIASTKPLPEDTTFSTPTYTVLDGQAAMVFASADGFVWALQPRTGKEIWKYQVSRRGMSVSPVVDGTTVYMAQNEVNIDSNSLGCIVAINGLGKGDVTKTNTVWKYLGPTDGKSSPLAFGGRVYCGDEQANFYVLDAKTGKPVCKTIKLLGTQTKATPLFADGKIYMPTTTGWQVLAPVADGLKVVDKHRLPLSDEVGGSPIVSHGRIYLPTRGALYCIGNKDAKPDKAAASKEDPALAALLPAPHKVDSELPVDKNASPACLQIVPCELTLKPGEKVQFAARLFNDRGQFLKTAVISDVKFALNGPGEVDRSGAFVAPTAHQQGATTITGKLGELSAEVRIRIIPPLPWKFDFDPIKLVENPRTKVLEGEPPVTWVGARHRHVIRDVDGKKVMVKISTIPKGTRSQMWMGPDDLHDYTIQTDQLGKLGRGKMPDMGVIAQRYTLDLMGETQELQIRSWTSQVASGFAKTIPFESKPDTWYTIKFQASNAGDAAVLKGKVWPRDQKEPKQWTIEATDPHPNRVGSPGLFGNATNGEIYIDNVLVYDNAQPTTKPAVSARAP